jgi:3-oxoacyl-(acyl-carrier-protein) synthase
MNYVVSEKQPHKINNAISNSFAFGGSDALLIISSSSSGKSR